MESTTPARSSFAPRTVPLTPTLELRIVPVADAAGVVTGLDCRLYRQLTHPQAGGAFAATTAGFRVPVAEVPVLVESLLALTREGV